jgi:two-component system, NtrC family, sensor histidine kinase KinB
MKIIAIRKSSSIFSPRQNPPDRVEQALRNFLRPGNLAALRELALLEVAREQSRHREELGLLQRDGGRRSGVSERVMVCLSSNPEGSEELLRKGARAAAQMNAERYAVHVETPKESVQKISTAEFRTGEKDHAHRRRTNASDSAEPLVAEVADQPDSRRGRRFRRSGGCPGDNRYKIVSPLSLRNRIRNGSLGMLVVALMLGALALPEVHQLGGSIREALYRNYVSIDAAQHMHAALWRVELAMRDGDAAAVLPASRHEFLHYIDIEEHDVTEAGEKQLAADIDRRAQQLLVEVATAPSGKVPGQEFVQLHQGLDELIAINRDAMFRADSRSAKMSDRLTYEFAGALVLLLVFGAMLSWTLAWSISKPLDELADRLRSFSLRGPSGRLGDQRLAELQAVASEFNKMAGRLEQFETLNVERLIYEKSKTEAIIESLEDGIVLIDAEGVVTHINGVAAIILGVERDEALGCPFDDLNSNHPHYLRVRAALRRIATQPLEAHRIEVDLHVRGRDHKPVPLRQGDAASFGTILVLQDITYLRDKDRARANLVATLSHELKTPLTSLALSAELLERGKEDLAAKQRELLTSINEDLARMRYLADDLLNLARGEAGAITVRSLPVDISELVRAVTRTFAPQFERKRVALTTDVNVMSTIRADPVKLSWVFSNLIANGLRYTQSGASMTISTESQNGKVRVKVTDTGPGIPPQVRDYLFERYAQWTVNGAPPGSAGLGLAIAKEIVEAHGGRIFVESTVGEGTCFTIELPAAPEVAWPSS